MFSLSLARALSLSLARALSLSTHKHTPHIRALDVAHTQTRRAMLRLKSSESGEWMWAARALTRTLARRRGSHRRRRRRRRRRRPSVRAC
jgi:hypothetical protein